MLRAHAPLAAAIRGYSGIQVPYAAFRYAIIFPRY